MRLRTKPLVSDTAAHKPLLDALVDQLRSPPDYRQPIITEDDRVGKGVVHVQVIWDRWQECSELERWKVIVEAYRQVRGDKLANQIRLATGFTVPEAVRIGLLPFELVPRPRARGVPAPEQYARAMVEEGASVLENPSKPVLRFETLEDTEVVLERLEHRLPGSRWSIIQHDPGTE